MKKSRIYYRDQNTNEVHYYEIDGNQIDYTELEEFMKKNKRTFLYITNITNGKAQAQN